MRRDPVRQSWCITALLLACAVAGAESGGIGLGPALTLVRDVQPGQRIDLRAVTGIAHHLSNRTGTVVTVEMVSTIPQAYGFSSFECGYEPAPDQVFLVQGVGEARRVLRFDLPPGTSENTSLIAEIPDRPESYNRHWMVYIEVGPLAQAARLGAGLRLRARVLLETASSANHGGGVLGVAPSVVVLDALGLNGTLSVRNGTQQDATIDLLPLSAAYPGSLADRRARFYAEALSAAHPEQAVPTPATLSLAGGTSAMVTFVAPAAEQVEEVWFAARRAPAGYDPTMVRVVAGVPYDRMELLRVRYPGYRTTGSVTATTP